MTRGEKRIIAEAVTDGMQLGIKLSTARSRAEADRITLELVEIITRAFSKLEEDTDGEGEGQNSRQARSTRWTC